jgi:hypothetical protein
MPSMPLQDPLQQVAAVAHDAPGPSQQRPEPPHERPPQSAALVQPQWEALTHEGPSGELAHDVHTPTNPEGTAPHAAALAPLAHCDVVGSQQPPLQYWLVTRLGTHATPH